MAFQITYNGDDPFILEATLRLIYEQPSDWIILVSHDDEVTEGVIIAFDAASAITLHVHDQEGQATGAETTIDIHDITELEIF